MSILIIPAIIEHNVKASQAKPAYEPTIKLYMSQAVLVKNIIILTKAVLLLP